MGNRKFFRGLFYRSGLKVVETQDAMPPFFENKNARDNQIPCVAYLVESYFIFAHLSDGNRQVSLPKNRRSGQPSFSPSEIGYCFRGARAGGGPAQNI